ncbi:MAG: RDD family protein [Myxococcales bacterium]|nr:RDD family protein [Myxococcales bacterium]
MRPSLATDDRAGEPARARQVITPEGVAVQFVIASRSARVGAFLLDVLMQVLAIAALAFLMSLAGAADDAGGGVLQLAFFLIWNFYFVFFEARWGGRTPGKRWMGIRVMDANGGRLELGAIMVRNLVRALEIWLPVSLYLEASGATPRQGWVMAGFAAWGLGNAALPFFSRNRQRIGDLLAGTWVVEVPKAELLHDLSAAQAHAQAQAQTQTRSAYGVSPARTFHFADAHLAHYGEYELSVLEATLRRDPASPGYDDALVTIANAIRAKIGFRDQVAPREALWFLQQFYAAQRATLEKRLLMGKRRKDKFN